MEFNPAFADDDDRTGQESHLSANADPEKGYVQEHTKHVQQHMVIVSGIYLAG
jgi:hypothetical protein